MFNEEEILWKGKPKIKLSFRFLESSSYYDVTSGFTSQITIYSFCIIFIVYSLCKNNHVIHGILVLFFGFVFPFLYEFIRYECQNKTKYAITKNHVLFKIFNGFRYEIYAIPIESILNVHLLKDQTGLGTIFLIVEKKVNFSTYNGRNGCKRDHPTLEFIEEYDKANSILHKLTAKNQGRKLVYKEPIIADRIFKLTKAAFTIVLGLMSLYLIDFYLLPTKSVVDNGSFSDRVYIERRKGNATELGGDNGTEKDYTYKTDYYYPELNSGNLEMEVSPIFQIVKRLKNDNMDYTDKLSNSLNNLIKRVIYLITYAVVFGGYLTLQKRTSIKDELYWKAVFSATAFFVVLFIAW